MVRRTLRLGELVALRLSLPRRLSREPLDTLLGSLTPTVKLPSPPGGLSVLRRDLLRVERGVARVPWVASTCLYRALGRYALLRRSGLDAVFVMGLVAEGPADTGHAWIEVEGEPFEEAHDVARYKVTFRYPPSRSDGKAGAP